MTDYSNTGEGKQTKLTPMAEVIMRQIKMLIGDNKANMLQMMFPRLEGLTSKFEVDSVQYYYFMLLTSLNPVSALQKYENRDTDSYWQTFWAYIAYANTGALPKAENALTELNKWSDRPEGNEILLYTAGTLLKYFNDFSHAELKEFATMQLDQAKLAIDPMLEPFTAALEMLADKAVIDTNNFYLAHTLSTFTTKRLQVDKQIAAKEKEEEELRKKAAEEARIKAEQEAKERAEREVREKAEKEARRKAEEEARRKAEEEARRKAEEEAKRKAEEEARLKAEEEAKRKAEEEAKLKAKQSKAMVMPAAEEKGETEKTIDVAGVVKDYQKKLQFRGAEQWLTENAEAGNVDAMFHLAQYYREGRPYVKRDAAKAAKWMSKAAEAGNETAKAIMSFGVTANFIDFTEEETRAAANNGNPYAMFWMWKLYDESSWLDEMRRKNLTGDSYYHFITGFSERYYALDSDGISKVNANLWHAVDEYIPDALVEMGLLLYYGSPQFRNIEINQYTACQYFKLAATLEEQNPDAEWYYGYCLYFGKGCDKDQDEGMEWIDKAANQGHDRAWDFSNRGKIGRMFMTMT